MNMEQYEKDLQTRRNQHFERIRFRKQKEWQPCLHDGCSQCFGTGIKEDGTSCVHMISCPCSKCSPVYM